MNISKYIKYTLGAAQEYVVMMVPIQTLVNLAIIIFYFLTTFQQYESVNTSKRNEVKPQAVHNTSLVQEKRRFNTPPKWRTGSTKGKLMNVTNKMSQRFTGSGGSVQNHSMNDLEERKERERSSVAIVKSVSYNLDDRENKDSQRLRRSDKSETNESVPENCKISKLSCRNCCENERLKDHCLNDTICYCDSHCTFYSDCCVDYSIFCENKHISFGVSRQGLSCIKPNYVVLHYTYPIWVVNKCPRHGDSDAISRNCETADDLQLNITTIKNFVPVIGENNLIFMNEFCAKCNGIERFEYFHNTIECDLVPPAVITSVAEMAEFVSRYCKIRISQMGNQISRRCYGYQTHVSPSQQNTTEECVSKLLSCQFTQDLEDYYRCVSLLQLDNNDTPNLWLGGIPGSHGAHVGPGSEGISGPGVIHTISTFSMVIDVSKGKPVYYVEKALCRKPLEQFYDPYLEICRFGKAIPPVKESLDRYDVVIWLRNADGSDNLPHVLDELISCFAGLFNFELSQVKEVAYVPIKDPFTIIMRFKLELTNEQTLRLGKVNYTNMNDAMLRFTNDTNNFTNILPLRRLLFFSGKFYFTWRGETIAVFKTTSCQLSCIRKRIYPQDTYISVENGEYYYINSTGKMFPKSQVFVENYMNKSISVCEQIVPSTCVGRQVNLTSEEYIKFDNLSIFWNRTEKIYDFGEYDIKNGKIFMCIPEGPPKLNSLNSSDSLFMESYLTFICLVLSLVCLFLVIQTYLIFPELRNLPGKNLLNLTMSLFLGQLLWLIPDECFMPNFCDVVAVIKHYLFLVSFVAMATIAWDTHLAFAGKGFQNRREEMKKRENKDFCKYSAIVWGLPAIFVVPCAVADRTDIYAVYVNEQLCWFDNVQPQKYLFVLPIGLLLLFNVIFFALTVFDIQRIRSDTRIIRADQRDKTMLWIVLKLSSLMGFSWLFGFIYLLVKTSTPVFSYLFVIFASLQGVYIAVAFVMKKKIWKMYKNFFRRNSRKSELDCTRDFLEDLKNSKETTL